MKSKPFATPYFGHDGRGPEIRRWICTDELFFPGSQVGDAEPDGSHIGIEHVLPEGEAAWVVFHGLQVIQIVPEEVSSYWHLDCIIDESSKSGVWEIEDSTWLKSFNPRHLSRHRHYVLEYYDDIVDVICRELILGPGTFDINSVAPVDDRFCYAYLRKADSLSKQGHYQEAVECYREYSKRTDSSSSGEYAERCAKHLITEHDLQ